MTPLAEPQHPTQVVSDLRARALRPLLSPRWAALALAASLAAVFGSIEAALRWVLGATFVPSLHLAVFFVGLDVGLGIVLLAAVAARLRLERRIVESSPPAAPPPLSVLVAAYDEADVIVQTVLSIADQRGVDFEIIVGDDGSNDGTIAVLRERFGLRAGEGRDQWVGDVVTADGRAVPLTALRRPHAGKGATLNAISTLARHPVLVTLDADTVPAPDAFVAMARVFADPEVDSAAGVVTVRNGRQNWLLYNQAAEYLKNAIARIGWSALGALEQVPGAFTAVRASSFRAVGGFPEDSITEDYELTYRLVSHGAVTGRVPLVVTVPSAQVLTDGPSRTMGFVRQRTRWFAGFLTTLARFRHLIGARSAGGFGVVRLPLKVVDAVLPLIAFGTLFVLGRAGFGALVPASRAALMLFAIRWVWDLFFYGMAERFGRELGHPASSARVAPRRAFAWLCTATEAVTYVWFKHVSTLRAYVWAARKMRTWERSRALPEAAAMPISERAPITR